MLLLTLETTSESSQSIYASRYLEASASRREKTSNTVSVHHLESYHARS